MTARFADNFVGVMDGTKPPQLADGRSVMSDIRVIVAMITLAAQAAADTIFIGRIPKGSQVLGFELNTDTSTATATLAIGIAGSAAKYTAAAALTATDTPTKRMKNDPIFDGPLAAEEDILLTIGTAALPASGQLVIATTFAIPH